MNSMNYKLDLKTDWVVCKLEDLGYGNNAIVDGPFGSNLKTSDYIDDSINGVPVLTTKNLAGDYSDDKVRFISKEKFEELKRSEVNGGDILVAKIGSIGKTGIYPKKMRSAIIPANLLKFTVNPRIIFNYVYNYLNFQGFQDLIQQIATATAQPAFNVTKFRKLPFPLPPLPEQRAIVSRIEQLFSELDNGIANLRLAQEQLKVYRQAVLKKAFEGELTRKWREQQTDLPDAQDLLEQIRIEREEAAKASGKKVKPVKPLTEDEIAELPGLPEGWGWVKVDNILSESDKGMTTGPFGTALKKYEHQKYGIPVYGIENIGEGVFRMPNKIFITEEKARELQAFSVKPYDIIISRSGTVGEICYIPERINSGIISTNLIRVRLNLDIVSPNFFVYLFQGGIVREQVKEVCKGSTRAFLNQTILSSIYFPLCSLPEQHAIVEEIETRLSVCDKMAQDIDEALEKAEALRQSILKKAFEGKLLNERELAEVRKAEDWEPAKVLLERVRAERAGNGKK